MKTTIVKVFSLTIILFCLLIVTGYFLLPQNSPNSNKKYLLVESWLPPHALEDNFHKIGFNDYLKVFVLGIEGRHDSIWLNKYRNQQSSLQKGGRFIKMPAKGAIYFSNAGLQKISKKKVFKKITVYARGDSSFYRYAHFFCAIGDSLLGQSFTSKQTRQYEFLGEFSYSQMLFFNLYFGNDFVYNGKDRNLIVDSVVLDSIALNKAAHFLRIRDTQLPEGLANFPFKSNSHFTCAYLHALGLKKDFIILDTSYYQKNKTAGIARLFRTVAGKMKIERDTFNTLSYNFHAFRSNLTFRRMIPNAHIGTICLPPLKRMNESWLIHKIHVMSVIIDEEISIAGTFLFYY